MPFDLANYFPASTLRSVVPPKYTGSGITRTSSSCNPAHKAVHQGIPHQTDRAIAMRAKHQQQAEAACMVSSVARYLVGIVGKIVNDGYFICGAHNLQPPADAAEPAQVGRALRESDAACLGDTQGGERVGHIVQPGAPALPRRPHRYRAPSLETSIPVGDRTGRDARRSACVARKL